MRFRGTLYRAHNPRWSFDPLSGEGSRIHGGRFNRPGTPALYLSTSIETAVREAAQGLTGKLDPLTIVSYDADLEALVDLSAEAGARAAGVDWAALSGPWKLQAAQGEDVPSWRLADALIARGSSGMLVPSFARGARQGDTNAVLWRWADAAPHRLAVHDPEDRLPRNQQSWK